MSEMADRIALVGTPSNPEAMWSEKRLAQLCDAGFTAVQLNIAWSYRPADEVLNLEDLVLVNGAPASSGREGDAGNPRRRSLLRERSSAAHRAGLRTLLHIGLPYQGRAGFEGAPLPQCISDPATARRYQQALTRLSQELPDVDDLLIYTYDQDAWLCSEFGECARCAGVPLHMRLPIFLNALAASWSEARPGSTLWWEPWELSAGQAMACIPKLSRTQMGLMLHNSIGEVMSTGAADQFTRNAAKLARRHGIPVVVEAFLSASNEEVEPWRHLPVPLVTLRQLRAIEGLDGVRGIKEYFGLQGDPFDVNLLAATAHFRDPTASDRQILHEVAGRFALTWLTEFWTLASEAYELYPWDASWFVRQLGRSDPIHALTAATIRGSQTAASEWDTPAWRSTRHSVFQRVDATEPHPWLLEDAELRFMAAAQKMSEAIEWARPHIELPPTSAAEQHIHAQVWEAEGFVTRTLAYGFHLRETNLARLLREGPRAGDITLAEELGHVLRRDAENQIRELSRRTRRRTEIPQPSTLQLMEKWVVPERDDIGAIVQAISVLDSSLTEFLSVYFLPEQGEAEAGQFSVTSR